MICMEKLHAESRLVLDRESVIEKIILNNKITQHLNNLKILKYIPLVLKDKIKNIFLRIGVLDKFFKNYKGILEDNFSIEEL